MRLPDFIIIGAMKAGTTTLYDYLSRHPEIFMATPKEPAFFARSDRFNLGTDWYSSLFAPARATQLCGEASVQYTNYAVWPKSAERMSRLLPKVKLIYMMRHPVQRAYSHYSQLLKHARARARDFDFSVPEAFEEFVQGDNAGIITSGDYFFQIRNYLQYFDRAQVLLILLDDLKREPVKVLREVYTFLNIDTAYAERGSEAIVKNQDADAREWVFRARTTAVLRRSRLFNPLASLVPQLLKDKAYEVLKHLPMGRHTEKTYNAPPMLPETRLQLLERYKEGNSALAAFLGRDLQNWSR